MSKSNLETTFAFIWRCLASDIKLEREYAFCKDRKWRVDFFHEPTKTAIEIEGGIWINGGHSRGKSFIKDCDKYNTMTTLGISLFRLTTNHLLDRNIRKTKHVQMIVDFIREKTNEKIT